MERQSIGQFLTALRKANGMTQKEFAEKLGVSDKAVSRWERDEYAPDLSLIPVIAEIFGVTADEILRGARNNPDQTNASEPQNEKRRQKQLERIVTEAKTHFFNRSLIAAGIGVGGLLAAMICNLAFYRGYLGFFCGCLFYAAALICETIFVRLAFSSLENEEWDGAVIASAKESLFCYACCAYTMITLLFAGTLPLVTLLPDPYFGLPAKSWTRYGFLYALAALVVCMLLIWLTEALLLKKDSDAYRRKNKLRLRYLAILAVALVLTIVIQTELHSVARHTGLFAQTRLFTDIDEFVVYMETSMTENGGEYPTQIEYISYDSEASSIEDLVSDKIPTASEAEEQSYTDSIYDPDGKFLRSYTCKNNSVSRIEYHWKNGKPAFRTWTHTGVRRQNEILGMFDTGFAFLYLLEMILVGIFYTRKLKKIRPRS